MSHTRLIVYRLLRKLSAFSGGSRASGVLESWGFFVRENEAESKWSY